MTLLTACTLAGLTMPLGALLGCVEHFHARWLEDEFRHSVMAFGGGALLSAVALVLVPDGIKHVSPAIAALLFLGGGFSFMILDIYLHKRRTQAGQLMAMLADFIPESIALGALFSTGSNTAYVLAGLIGLQNLPEGFNAYRELKDSSTLSSKTIVLRFTGLALLGPLAGASGYFYLHDAPQIVGAIMLYAAGGIFYAIFQDIAPQVKLEKHYAPPMSALLGFVLGLIGFMCSH